MADKLEFLGSVTLGNLRSLKGRLEKLPPWPAEEIEGLKALPDHLQSRTAIISTHATKRWVPQAGVVIPGSSVVTLYGCEGTAKMGHDQHVPTTVDCRGFFVHSGQPHAQAADGDYPMPGMNRYCFLVGTFTGSTLRVVFQNHGIPHFGASVGGPQPFAVSWVLDANQGGQICTSFNDNNDSDNSGYITQRIEWRPVSSFLKWVENLM